MQANKTVIYVTKVSFFKLGATFNDIGRLTSCTTEVNTYIYAKDVRKSNVKCVDAIQSTAHFSSGRLLTRSTGSS